MEREEIAEKLVAAVVARLREAREEKGLSLRGLEALCGISNGGIHHIETGLRSPTLYSLARIAQALDLKLGDLVAEGEAHVEKRRGKR